MMALVVRLRSELLLLLCLVSSRSQEYALEEAVKKKNNKPKLSQNEHLLDNLSFYPSFCQICPGLLLGDNVMPERVCVLPKVFLRVWQL